MTDQKEGNVKAVCAMIMAFSAFTIENFWYLDFAAKVHITYDSSNFKTLILKFFLLFQTTDNTSTQFFKKVQF